MSNSIIELNNKDELSPLLTSNKTIKKLKKLLIILIEVLDKINIKWWADSGTLLGLIRHKSIIPWDDDIDLGMLLIDEYKIYNNLNIFKKFNLRIRKNRTNVYWQIDMLTNNNLLNEIHIDLFLYKKNNNELTYYNTDERFKFPNLVNGHCNMFYKQSDLFPLIKKPFYNFYLNCPNNYNNILEICIGKDFMTNKLIKKNGNVYKIVSNLLQ